MSDELRTMIGAMVMVGVCGGAPGDADLEADLAICEEAQIGGVILFDVDLPEMSRLISCGADVAEARRRAARNIESPEQVRRLTRYLRERLGDDLVIAIDHEGGITTRLSPARGFPTSRSAAEWAALSPDERNDEAERVAAIASVAGVTLNFAPCVDLAICEASPIIAKRGRAYGATHEVVVECAASLIRAHQRKGLLTCLKHFPGHGSAVLDSHVDLPRASDASRELELGPYRALIPRLDASTWVMTGHLLHESTDAQAPASLSRAHTMGVLREQLGFDGVVVTDSLDMGAVLKQWTLEEAVVMAINAGADVLLDGVNALGDARENPALRLVTTIERALQDGRIKGGEPRLQESVNRIRRSLRSVRNVAD